MEELLIAAVMAIMCIYCHPQGKYGYSGHVINLTKNAVSFASSLPRLPSELDVRMWREENNYLHCQNTTYDIHIYEFVFLIYNCSFSPHCSILVKCLLRLAPQCLHFNYIVYSTIEIISLTIARFKKTSHALSPPLLSHECNLKIL